MTEEINVVTENVKVEEPRTIFEGIREFNFYTNMLMSLRFDKYFKDLGFERVNINKEFGIHTFYPQLTLMINPALSIPEDRYNETNNINKFTSLLVGGREPSFELWNKFLINKRGLIGNTIRNHYIIKKSDEEVKPIKILCEGKDLILAQYLKERNIVMLYINPFKTDISIENNEYQELILKLFEDKIKEIKLEKVDVTEKIMKFAFIEKFKTEINNKLEEVRNSLVNCEEHINNYQTSIIKSIRNAQLAKKQIEGLVIFSNNTDNTIKKQIEDLKELPFVSNVNLASNGIGMDIGSITIKYINREIYIGDFYIVISPDRVRIYCKNPILNADNKELLHPHINEGNNCYGGERSLKITEYLSGFELKKVVYYIYMFLKTYTPNDSYNPLSEWMKDKVIRRETEDIKSGNDISNIEFQGDYFYYNRRNHNSDDDNSDGDNEDNYLGDCVQCGDSVYNGENNYDSDDNGHYCSESCFNEYHNDENHN